MREAFIDLIRKMKNAAELAEKVHTVLREARYRGNDEIGPPVSNNDIGPSVSDDQIRLSVSDDDEKI